MILVFGRHINNEKVDDKYDFRRPDIKAKIILNFCGKTDHFLLFERIRQYDFDLSLKKNLFFFFGESDFHPSDFHPRGYGHLTVILTSQKS